MLNYNYSEMDFKEFNEMVKTYYPLNKEKTRYLILFLNGGFEFYKYDDKNKTLIKEVERYN